MIIARQDPLSQQTLDGVLVVRDGPLPHRFERDDAELHHGGCLGGTQESFILADYGTHVAELQAVPALVERAERALAPLYTQAANGHDITAEERGQVAEIIAAAKVRAIHAGLAATSGLFDLAGARSTATAHGLDRFWRNLRTLSLHDPVAYKQHELGQCFVNGQLPTPSGYR